jgi:hypothetical protein
MVNALNIGGLEGKEGLIRTGFEAILIIVLVTGEWGLAYIVKDNAKHFVGPQGIKSFRNHVFCGTFCSYNHNNTINHFFEDIHIGQWQNRWRINKNEIVLLT